MRAAKQIYAIALLLLLSSSALGVTVNDFYEQEANKMPVDLTLPLEARWNSFPRAYCDRLEDFIPTFQKTYIEKVFKNKNRYDEVEKIALKFLDYPHNEAYKKELVGIARRCRISEGFLAMYNIMYEFGILAGCTSIVYIDGSSARVASNLDYEFGNYFADQIFHATYYLGGYKLFEARQLFGFVGFVNAANEHFSASLNAREWKNSDDFDSFLKDLEEGNAKLVVYHFRKVFEEKLSYDGFVEGVKTETKLAPAYYTVADHAAKRGVVIARGYLGVDEEKELSTENWFLVQTNSDQGVEDERRPAAEVKLRSFGEGNREITRKIVKDVLSQQPNFEIKLDEDGEVKIRTISTSYVVLEPQFKLEVSVWKPNVVVSSSSDSDSRVTNDLR